MYIHNIVDRCKKCWQKKRYKAFSNKISVENKWICLISNEKLWFLLEMRYKKILRILKRRIESVKDMNKTTKEMISEYITDKTNKFDLVHTDMFTTVSIADALHISRSITSQYLNELCEEDEIYKVKSRPVYFFDGVALEKKFHVSIRNQEFLDM